MNEMDISLFDIFEIHSEPNALLSDEEFSRILREEETKISNDHNRMEVSLFDEILGVRSEPHGQLRDEEFERILHLEETKKSTENKNKTNPPDSSSQDTIDWNRIFGAERYPNDNSDGHRSYHTLENVSPIIFHDSGFSEEGLSTSKSSLSTSPMDSEICEQKDSNDQCSQLIESPPKATSSPFLINRYKQSWSNANKYEIDPTSAISISDAENNAKPILNIKEGVKKLQKQKVFKCLKCEFFSLFKETLDQHIYKEHIKPNQECGQKQSKENLTFKCELCDFQTANVALVVNHKYEVHDMRNFQCVRCEWKTTSVLEYIVHLNENPTHISSFLRNPFSRYKNGNKSAEQYSKTTHEKPLSFNDANDIATWEQAQSDKTKAFTCELGDFESEDFALFAYHKYEVHGMTNFLCARCDLRTKSVLEYIAHMTQFPTHVSYIPSSNRSDQENMERRSPKENPGITRGAWKERKEQRRPLNVVNSTTLQNMVYPCKECSFATPKIEMLVTHKFAIHKCRKFECPRCRASMTSHNASIEHFRKNPSHMIPYVDENTNKTRRQKKYRYKSDENLIIQVKQEGNKEKIVITPRSHCFKNRKGREMKFFCEVCKFHTLSYKELLVHRKTVHNLEISCTGCFEKFISLYELKKHMMDHPC